MNFFLVLSIFFLAPGIAGAQAIGHECLPPEHWCYDAFDRFEALGFCELPSERPFSRDDAVAFVSEIRRNFEEKNRCLSPRDAYNLERLEEEFSSLSSQSDPRARYDPPAVFLTDRPVYLEGDLDMSSLAKRGLFDERMDFFLLGKPEIRFHFLSLATYEVRYRLTFGPERGDRARNAKPSRRERSFKGLTSLFERSYFIIRSDKVSFLLGRDYAYWGPSDRGNLILSNIQSLDHLRFRAELKSLRLVMIHSLLSPEKKRYLSAHRLEVKWKGFLLGVSESVLYAGRGFEPAYALPLASFYANQFNEKGDDNILWGVDLKCTPSDRVLFYGSLLVDDFQFERDGSAPDKLAFNIGTRLALDEPVAFTVRAWYRFIDIYTYTHRDSLKAYLGGEGSLRAGDELLGGEGWPDSDSWLLSADFFPRPNLKATLAFYGVRRGEGDDFRGFGGELDPDPAFPSGVVEKTLGFGAAIRWEWHGGSYLGMDVLRERVKNGEHSAGRRESRSSFSLSLAWDL